MIGNQKAIEAIKSNYPPENYSILREALDLSITLLEKATPMKPNEETATSEFIDDHPITVMIYRCAKCGGRVHPFDGDLYCRHCGQALDWGDDQ